jgi:hypothetical protein
MMKFPVNNSSDEREFSFILKTTTGSLNATQPTLSITISELILKQLDSDLFSTTDEAQQKIVLSTVDEVGRHW